MDFDEAIKLVLQDKRTDKIPILYVIQIVMILDDKHLLKEICYE